MTVLMLEGEAIVRVLVLLVGYRVVAEGARRGNLAMPWSPGPDFLRYDVEHVNGRATVRLAGELDLASRAVGQRALAVAASGSAETVLDLSRVTFIDAAGLRLLFTAQRDARAASHRLLIRRPHRVVRRVLELTGMLACLDLEGPDDGHCVFAGNGDVVAICSAAIDTAVRMDRADTANVQLFDPRTRELRIIAQQGFRRNFLDFFEVVDDEESACGTALNSGRSVWVPDTTRSAIFTGTPALEVMLDAGSRAVASLPVLAPTGRLLAMMSTHYRRREAWTNDRKLRLEQLASSTGRLLHDLMPGVPVA